MKCTAKRRRGLSVPWNWQLSTGARSSGRTSGHPGGSLGLVCRFWSSRALDMNSKDLVSSRDHPEEMARKSRSGLEASPLPTHLPAAWRPPSWSATAQGRASVPPVLTGQRPSRDWPPGRSGLPHFLRLAQPGRWPVDEDSHRCPVSHPVQIRRRNDLQGFSLGIRPAVILTPWPAQGWLSINTATPPQQAGTSSSAPLGIRWGTAQGATSLKTLTLKHNSSDFYFSYMWSVLAEWCMGNAFWLTTGCFSKTELGPTALFFHQSHLGDLLDSLGFRVGGFRIEGLRLRVRSYCSVS